MAIKIDEGHDLFVSVEGLNTNLGISSREPKRAERCRSFAAQEGLGGCFLKVVIGPVASEGDKIATEGLDELAKNLNLAGQIGGEPDPS